MIQLLLLARLAIVVGNNTGFPDEVALRYAESDARKVARALVDLGGFAPGDVHLVEGRGPEAIRALLGGLSVGEGGEVFFYYSGHGDGQRLHMAGGALGIDELRGLLERVGASLRVLIVDACRSGAFIRAKGARQGPPFEIELLQDPHARGTITITSSSEDEVAQESDRIEGSFFTHYWVSGLYGAADANGDGVVTLEEAYRFAHFQTLTRTIESHGGVQHPSFRYALEGQGSVVMANLALASARIRIAGSSHAGQYFVVDPDKQLVLTEITRAGAGEADVRLPPGRYRVRKREPDRLLIADVTLVAGQTALLRDEDMTAAPYATQKAKGSGLPLGLDGHGPHLTMGARSPLTAEMSATATLKLGYRLRWGPIIAEPRVVLRSATVDGGAGRELRYAEGDLGGSLLWQFRGERVSAAVGLDSGAMVFDQDALMASTQTGPGPSGVVSVGLEGGALGELAWAVTPHFSISLEPNVGMALFKLNGSTTTALVAGAALGVEYEFSP